MKAKKFLLIFVLSFGLTACMQNPGASMDVAVTPTFHPQVTEAEMVLETPTSPVDVMQIDMADTSQTALPVLPSPEVTQAVLEKPTDFSPVLYGGNLYGTTFFLLLGGVGTEAWLTPDESFARFSGEVTYSLHSMTQEYKYFLWGKVPEFSPAYNIYTISTDAGLDEAGFVGVVDGWNITKREVTELSGDIQLYWQAVLDWLAAEGVDDPQLGTLQIFRSDIGGDGSDEVFISATHLDESQHTTKAGDYSIVLMRKIVGNDVVTIPLVADIYSSQELEITFPRTYSLANFIDLNQDGILEVVVDIQKWEGFGAIVYELDDQKVTEALRAE